MMRSRARAVLLAAVAVVLAACAMAGPTGDGGANDLRVGVTTTYPPIIFRAGGPTTGTISGVEADLARRLGQALGRRVRFFDMRWEEQIPLLLAGRTDIIMSGMSITPERQVRVSFAEPYLETGLAVAMRTEDRPRYASREQIMASQASVGVIERTTGDVFVQRNLPRARRVALARATDGALELKRRTIDLFIHDAPAVMWLVSENEADLVGSWELLDRQQLAWAMRREDTALLEHVNAVLDAWRRDGTLEAVLSKWLPYRRR
jgi:ABC-type amino acid transport substrate-binding protein